MSTYLCPKGHQSSESDYCSECGTRIQGSAALVVASSPEPSSTWSNLAGQVTCPDCAAPHDSDSGNFCEICGYNFVTGAHGEIPIALSHPPIAEPLPSDPGEPTQKQTAIDAVASTPAPLSWEIRVTIDAVAHDAESPPSPKNISPFNVPLQPGNNLIGRTSPARAIHPQISLDFDDAVSHRHALLHLSSDGVLILRDIGSSNGTKLNEVELQPMIDIPVKSGDEMTLGHWTRIQILIDS